MYMKPASASDFGALRVGGIELAVARRHEIGRRASTLRELEDLERRGVDGRSSRGGRLRGASVKVSAFSSSSESSADICTSPSL